MQLFISPTQGEQVIGVWKLLYERFGIHIDFAHRTFRWDSEASLKAHVHCVIVGFSIAQNYEQKHLFSGDRPQAVEIISPYLINAPVNFIESTAKPISPVPLMSSGGKPVEGGHLIFTTDEKRELLEKEPGAEKFFKRFVGSDDFINGYERWCLWLLSISPKELNALPHVMERVEEARKFRLSSTKAATRNCADYPTRFMEIKQPQVSF